MTGDIAETKFVAELVLGATVKDAAKAAGISASTATRLMKKPEIIAAIEAEKAAIRERTKYDAEQAMRELDEALAMARQLRDTKAMNAIIISRMKLNGLSPDRLIVEERPSIAAALDRKFRAIAGEIRQDDR
jgi:DNA-binding LacI/PurR family transcriptional regulator